MRKEIRFFAFMITCLLHIFCCENVLGQKVIVPVRKNSNLEIDTSIYYRNKIDKKAIIKGGDSLLTNYFSKHLKFDNNLRMPYGLHYTFCLVVEVNGKCTNLPQNVVKDRNSYNSGGWWQVYDSLMPLLNKLPIFNPAVKNGKKVRSANCIEIAICSNRQVNCIIQSEEPHEEGLIICDQGYYEPCVINDDSIVFDYAEKMPQFPNGTDSMFSFISHNLIYPPIAFGNNVSGRVKVSFIVEKDGSLSNINADKNLGFGCPEEAIRIIKLFPRFEIGIQNGKPVRVQYRMAIEFSR